MRKTTIALCLMAATNSWAETVSKDDLAKCASNSNVVERLACFDALAEKMGAVATTEDTTEPQAGKWRTSTHTDPLTDKSVHIAQLEASTGRGKYGDAIVMVVRCKDNKTDMYIDWGSFLGSDSTRVTHRIGKEKAATTRWGISTDHKASFFPNSPISTLKGMMETDSFVVNVTPYSESPVTAVFETTGAKDALADIRKGCGW